MLKTPTYVCTLHASFYRKGILRETNGMYLTNPGVQFRLNWPNVRHAFWSMYSNRTFGRKGVSVHTSLWFKVCIYVTEFTVIYVSRYAPFGSRKCVLTTSRLIHATSREIYWKLWKYKFSKSKRLRLQRYANRRTFLRLEETFAFFSFFFFFFGRITSMFWTDFKLKIHNHWFLFRQKAEFTFNYN